MTTLTLHQVTRTYAATVPVDALKATTLSIHQGDFVAIEGPSGAGKSTLLNVLALLDLPTSGTYTIDDHDVSHLHDSQAANLRSNTFGFIFQSFHLLPQRSAVENVMLGMAYQGALPQSAKQRAYQALEFVGLKERADLPTERLSGGERQRIAIARAICAQAPIIVADEPTGNLDSRSSELVMDLLEQLNSQGTTIIIVTHDPTVASRATRRIHVIDGVVSESKTEHHPTPHRGPTQDVSDSSTNTPQPSHLHYSMLWHDTIQALSTDLGRTLRLVAVVVTAVTLFLTVTSLSYTARYQVSDVFNSQLNKRVAVGLIDPDQTGYIQDNVAHPDPHAIQRLASIEGIDEAMLISTHSSHEVSADPLIAPSRIPLFGLTPITDLNKLLTINGQSLPLKQGQILVGTSAASACGLGPFDASPTVWIDGVPYEVAGIITDAGIRSDLLTGIVMTQQDASAIEPSATNVLEIHALPGAAPSVAHVAAVAWVPDHVDTTMTEAPPDPRGMRDELEQNIRSALLTLTVVSALAGLAILSNAMTNSVHIRTGELALRRAMGATRRQIRTLISAESALIGLIGGAIGSVLSLLIVLAITIAHQWRPVIDPMSFPLGIAVGTITGFIAAVIASRKAGKIHPAQALR